MTDPVIVITALLEAAVYAPMEAAVYAHIKWVGIECTRVNPVAVSSLTSDA